MSLDDKVDRIEHFLLVEYGHDPNLLQQAVVQMMLIASTWGPQAVTAAGRVRRLLHLKGKI